MTRRHVLSAVTLGSGDMDLSDVSYGDLFATTSDAADVRWQHVKDADDLYTAGKRAVKGAGYVVMHSVMMAGMKAVSNPSVQEGFDTVVNTAYDFGIINEEDIPQVEQYLADQGVLDEVTVRRASKQEVRPDLRDRVEDAGSGLRMMPRHLRDIVVELPAPMNISRMETVLDDRGYIFGCEGDVLYAAIAEDEIDYAQELRPRVGTVKEMYSGEKYLREGYEHINLAFEPDVVYPLGAGAHSPSAFTDSGAPCEELQILSDYLQRK